MQIDKCWFYQYAYYIIYACQLNILPRRSIEKQWETGRLMDSMPNLIFKHSNTLSHFSVKEKVGLTTGGMID